MALNQVAGFNTGYLATRMSSFDRRAIGKVTDTNHLYSLHQKAPSKYDKALIQLYTQTATYSNDFINMIYQSDPFTPTTDTWSWKVGVPYTFPSIVEIPASTQAMSTPGIDGQVFELVLDRKAFFINDTFVADRRYAPLLIVTEDPTPYNGAWKYRVALVTNNPQTTYIDTQWLRVGIEVIRVGNMVGEFDQELSGLPELAQTMTFFETMAAGYGIEHKMTKWASQMAQTDKDGNPLDIMVYTKYERNNIGKPKLLDMRWESFVEAEMRKWMLDTKVSQFIWSQPGTAKAHGTFQEVKKSIEGLYWKIRNLGNYHTYNRGDFSINLMRNIYGDLFYRREDIKDRKVRVYTNEAGIEVWRQALKRDMLNSGLTINAGSNDKFIQGSGQGMTVNYSFDALYTIDTGEVRMIHLKELDQPQTNSEFGQNKKSTPIFIVFDISPESDGTPKNNVREVRLKNAPSMTWGYVNGRSSWQGFAASQGMMSASMDPAAVAWMEDRCDIFVEDLSRMVIIEEIPQF